jgi:hypothetical protein
VKKLTGSSVEAGELAGQTVQREEIQK